MCAGKCTSLFAGYSERSIPHSDMNSSASNATASSSPNTKSWKQVLRPRNFGTRRRRTRSGGPSVAPKRAALVSETPQGEAAPKSPGRLLDDGRRPSPRSPCRSPRRHGGVSFNPYLQIPSSGSGTRQEGAAAQSSSSADQVPFSPLLSPTQVWGMDEPAEEDRSAFLFSSRLPRSAPCRVALSPEVQSVASDDS